MQRLIDHIASRQGTYPEGSLQLDNRNGKTNYYHYMPGGKHKGKYIPRQDQKLIHQLAQKTYDKEILSCVQTRIKHIDLLLNDYSQNLEQIHSSKSEGRRQLIHPYFPTWEEKVESWMAKEEAALPIDFGKAIHKTERGEYVRSKSERDIANYLFGKGIPYKYESPLLFPGHEPIYPDFKVLARRDYKEICWEHLGMMDDPKYASKWISKMNLYMENGYFIGDNLIVTMESRDQPLQMEVIECIVKKYFLDELAGQS